MSKTAITDTRVRLRPSKALLKLLDEHKDKMTEVPTNVAKALKSNGYTVASKVEILQKDFSGNAPKLDLELLRSLFDSTENTAEPATADEQSKDSGQESTANVDSTVDYLYLSDLRWLNEWLTTLRKDRATNVFLHNVIESCELVLPENGTLERNPELEARCQKLREEQQNREYLKMTKNVDSSLKYVPEDTVAFQLKTLNSQMIAVLQFVFSVIAGFVFGFLGIQLIVGNLDFGFRLLLGIMFALIIALAEIYFLAKKLNEYDDAIVSLKKQSTPVKQKKAHVD